MTESPEPGLAEPDGPDEPDEPVEDQAADQLTAEERRRLRARVFGEVLPESTRDDRGDDWGERGERSDGGAGSDEWLKAQVPPHHG